MLWRTLLSLVLLAIVVELAPANNDSGTRLTPANLRQQPLDFVIHAEKIGVLTRFMVSVKRTTVPSPPALAGYLVIVDGKTKLASCSVAAAKQPKIVVYEFLVNSKHLEKSRFLLEEKDTRTKGTPAADSYWFYLEDFALAQVSASSEAPASKP